MFQNNKYTKCYIEIIERSRKRIIVGYTERHHIIPKCLFNRADNLSNGKVDDISNIVTLTAREHFICHRLLTKMLDKNDPDRRKLFYAVSSFKMTKNGERILSSHQYQKVKEALSVASRCRMVSLETREKLSKAAKKFTQRLEWKERQRTAQQSSPRRSDETRSNMSKASNGKPKSASHAMNISKGMQSYLSDPEIRKKRSEQSSKILNDPIIRKKISDALRGRTLSQEHRDLISTNAKIRCQDPDYLEKQSKAQKSRWAENPQKWWTNGESNTRSVDSPGSSWYRGRTRNPSGNA